MNVQESIDSAVRQIKLLQAGVDFLEKHGQYLDDNNLRACISPYSNRIEIALNDKPFKTTLAEARQHMKHLFGEWRGKFSGTWNPYGEDVIMSWDDKDSSFSLWIRTTIDQFPEELKTKETCRWVKSQPTTYEFVCEV